MGNMERRQTPTLRQRVTHMASHMLVDLVGEDRATEATARVAMAFAAACRAARNPQDIERCSPESIGAAVAMSALTGLMPGGAMPSVWLVPRGGQLQWMISHRGLLTLCRRAGYQLVAVPVGKEDHIRIEFGEVVEHEAKPGAEPSTLGDLAGVIVSCRRIADGAILGRYWMPGADVRKRQKKSAGGSVWRDWPMEMAAKTAIKWACARGLVPIDSIELDRALQADTRAEVAPEPQRRTVPTFEDVRALPAPEPEEVAAEVLDAGAVRAAGGES